MDEHRSAFAEYEVAEHAYMQAIRDRADWAALGSRAAEVAAKVHAWDAAARAAWCTARDDNRQALALEIDTTEALSDLWSDIALAYEGKPALAF